MVVAFATTPVHTELLWRHHEGRALEGRGAPFFRRCQLPRVPQISKLDLEFDRIKVHRLLILVSR